MDFDEYKSKRRELEIAEDSLRSQQRILSQVRDEQLIEERASREWTEWFAAATEGVPGMGAAAQDLLDEGRTAHNKTAIEFEELRDDLNARIKGIGDQIDELDAEWRETCEGE